MSARFTELIIDCAEPGRLANFWAAVLGYAVLESGADGVSIGDESSAGPKLVFVPVPESKSLKNRIHIDLSPTGHEQAAELERLRGLGARQVDVGQGPDVSWIVLADPEGNEFCLLRPQVD